MSAMLADTMYSCYTLGIIYAYRLGYILVYTRLFHVEHILDYSIGWLCYWMSDWFITRNNLVNYPTNQLSTIYTPINKPISLQNNSGI